MAMDQPTHHDDSEGEATALDTLTRAELDQAADDYDENKQRIDLAPTAKQLLGPFTVVCLVLNRLIGSGIFTIPPKVLAGTGSVGGALMIWSFGGVIAICGALCWLEVGLSIPFHKVEENGVEIEVSAPRSGGEKNMLEFIFNKPKLLMTCMFGIMFLILGNIAGNGIAFGMYIAIAAGKDPIYDKDNNYNKALVNGLAVLVLSVCAALHVFSRRGGILVNNALAIIKVSIVFVLAILGFVHAGGKYLQASGINEPAIPHYTGSIFNITDAQINGATRTNFNDPFVTKRHDLGSYVDSFLFVVFTFTGFDQPFYVLSEVARPRKVFPPAMMTAIVLSAVLYILINVSYFCVVPKEVYTSSPANALNMAGAFLHYLFDNSYGPQTAERVMAGLIAICVFGNLLVMTFTASRVKQEIAKEGILPKSLIFASGQTTPWAWLKNRSRSASDQHEAGPTSGINLEDHPEKSPMAALALHWCSSIFLVLITIPLKPATQYSFLTELYGYTNFVVIGFLVSAGLIYLKLDSYRGEKGRQWSKKVSFVPWLSPCHAIVYFLATTFFLIAAFVPPNSASVYSTDIQGYPWYVVPAVGLYSLLWGVIWWFGLKWIQWRRSRILVVIRTPYLEKDEDGNYVQKAELVEHEWPTVVRSDAESEKIVDS